MKGFIQPVIIAVIRHNNKYLLTKRVANDPEDNPFHDLWQLPGGGLEFNETAVECLRREIREELGTEIKIRGMIPAVFERIYGRRWHGLLICYMCELRNPRAKITLNHEASEYAWYTLKETKRLKKLPLLDKILSEAEKL